MRMKPFFLAALLLTPWVFAQGDLPQAGEGVRQALEEAGEERLKARRELERLRKDLRTVSEQLDREVMGEGEGKGLAEYSKGGLSRLDYLRQEGEIAPRLAPVLRRLEGIYRDLPKRRYAADYATGLLRAVSDELRWAASEARSEQELLGLLEEDLAIPERIPTEAEPRDAEALAFFPEDIPLEEFKGLGVIKAFLMKHRLGRPKSHARTTAEDIVAGRHNVQVGVELEGRVTGFFKAKDQDYTFDIGALHIELTPEWRLLHPGIPEPKTGDRIRIRGWTYWDKFHELELEYNPEDPVLGIQRLSLWEVHPVQDIEILP